STEITPTVSILSFSFHCYSDHHDLHSFPTRRSSDLHDRTGASPCQSAEQASGADEEHRSRRPAAHGESRGVADAKDEPCRDKDTDRKSTRLNSSHVAISYAVFCLKKKKKYDSKKTAY